MAKYKQLTVWRNSCALAKAIYTHTRHVPREEGFGMTSQMRRAAVSIPSNIAEGAGRATRPDFRHFITMARGSLAELQTLVELSLEFGYLNASQARELDVLMDEISRMLYALDHNLPAKK